MLLLRKKFLKFWSSKIQNFDMQWSPFCRTIRYTCFHVLYLQIAQLPEFWWFSKHVAENRRVVTSRKSILPESFQTNQVQIFTEAVKLMAKEARKSGGAARRHLGILDFGHFWTTIEPVCGVLHFPLLRNGYAHTALISISTLGDSRQGDLGFQILNI